MGVVAGTEGCPPRAQIPRGSRVEGAVRLRNTNTNGQLHGKPASGIESKYLLSGHLRCGTCGGNLIVNKTQGKRGRPVIRYVCSNHKQRPGSCDNKKGLSVVTAHEAVLAQLRQEMSWAVIADRLSVMIKAPAAHEQERQALTAQVADLDRKLSNLADAMEATGGDPVLAARMKDARRQRDEAAARLEHLDGLTRGELPDFTTEAGRASWAAEIRPLLENLRATLEGEPAKARQRVKEVLPEPIKATVTEEPDGTVSWTLEGTTSYEAVRVDLGTGKVTNVGQVSRPVAGRVLNKRGSVDAMWCPRRGPLGLG